MLKYDWEDVFDRDGFPVLVSSWSPERGLRYNAYSFCVKVRIYTSQNLYISDLASFSYCKL